MANTMVTAKESGRRGFDFVGFMEKYGVLLFLILLFYSFQPTIRASYPRETSPTS